MTVHARTVTVTTSATRIDSSTQTDNAIQHSGTIKNTGSATIYIGGSDVTTSGLGATFAVGDRVEFDFDGGDALYGIVASGTGTVEVLESGL